MRLSLKILIPLLLLLALLGSTGAGFYSVLREQQAVLRNVSDRLATANYRTLELQGQHKTIMLNLLSYRFDRRPARLEVIAHADRETLVAVNAYRALAIDSGMEELLRAFTIALTASFGAACRMVGADTPDALMQRADAALYAAKAGGRNRVAVAHANKAETAEPSA